MSTTRSTNVEEPWCDHPLCLGPKNRNVMLSLAPGDSIKANLGVSRWQESDHILFSIKKTNISDIIGTTFIHLYRW